MRYLITGGSGYIGSRLVERLSGEPSTDQIVIADVRPPRVFRPKAEYRALDVTDGPGVRRLIEAERPDAIVHLAFVLNPIRNEARMYEIDVGGTHNVLEAATSADVQHLLVVSSAVAYGAFPDNPVPLTEDHPLRGVPDFSYARDKTESDRLCQLWALLHPDRTTTIVRPCIVFGPNVDNYLVRLWTNQPFQAAFGLPDPGIQFVHEDDLVEAISRLLVARRPGVFNVAGEGKMAISECAALIGMRRLRVPRRPFWWLAALLWRVGLSEAPPGALKYSMYPWIVSTEKLAREAAWRPAHTSRDTFVETMRKHGKLAEPPS